MAASGKFELSSGSPDRPLYNSGQRGSYTSASLDRSGSFRENMDNTILSAIPSMSRSIVTVTQGEAIHFLRCLRFDPKSMVVDHKFNRQVEFNRLASNALGILPDDPSGSSKGKLSLSPEEFKRLRTGLRESSIKARERMKIFSDSLSAFNKCFPSIPSRKRSRSDVLSGDRSSAFFPCDRSALGTGSGKMGTQSHSTGGGFEFEQQRSEERTKNAAPSKRTRTSMVDHRMDIRANTPARTSGNVDKDRETIRIPNSSAVQGEDRTLPIGVDGWEKSKMKKKRSGIKPDVVSSTVSAKPIDVCREPKQGMQPRLLNDTRSRMNDPHGFRPGFANGASGGGKSDGILQQTGLGLRSSILKADQDNNSILNDRRDRPSALDKERVNAVRPLNKANAREDLSSVSPTSSTKLSSAARAPRSGSSVVPKLAPMVQRAAVANEWELSHCVSKLPAAVGPNNRKRTPSTQSSSPSVTNWAGTRPQKMSRTARRTSFTVVSNNDENSVFDTVTDVTGQENGSGLTKRMPGNSPQHVKLKGDIFSSAALSESEESGAVEHKSKDKSKKSNDVDEKAGHNIQKISTLALPPRKNKVGIVDDLGDGVRRQGRTGRGFTSTRSLMPITVEKLGNVGTGKQLRSARIGFDKTESKAGRPPTRKLSDRKAYARQKHTATNVAADFLVGSDDGHEDLLAAANAVINPTHALSSPFWKRVEPLFGYISDVDIAYIKQQENLRSVAAAAAANLVPSSVDTSSKVNNGYALIEPVGDLTETKDIELSPEHIGLGTRTPNEITLCQKLLAALITEEGCDVLSNCRNEDLKFDVYGSGYEQHADLEPDTFDYQTLQGFELGGSASNGHTKSSLRRSLNEPEHNIPENDIMAIPDFGVISTFDLSRNGLIPDQAIIQGKACSDYEYNNMSINERLLLEVHSIGLSSEPVPELAHTGDEEISRDIMRLEDMYREQVSKKKSLLRNLLKSASETKEFQEKEFEQSALDKLVVMDYEKYMSCWGPNASGGKSASSKIAKQTALAFVKRTLERLQEFEDTGKSCFSEPLYRDMFLSGTSRLNTAEPVQAITDGESGKSYANTSNCSTEFRSLAPVGLQKSPSLNNHDIYSSDAFVSVNYSSEHTIGKEDSPSNRVKKRELLLDDVGGGAIATSSVGTSGLGSSFSSSTKGKRSEREREGKGNCREVMPRNGTAKIGRPASNNFKGERKSKTKPKQKTAQLSASGNGFLGKASDHSKVTLPSVPKSSERSTSVSGKGTDEFALDVLDDHEVLDLSNLQLPEMDVLGVPDDLGGQGEDIASWLNIDDDGLQDHDFMGLEIPMDDLSDLNMMV